MASMTATDSDGASGAQRTDYSKGSSKMGKDSKEISSSSMPMTKAGGKSGSGPTGSKDSYPKGSKVSMSADFVPTGKNTYGINGV